MQQVKVGDVVKGKVSGIKNFGAFIQLPGGKTGLVHISEIAREYVKDVNNHLKEDQVVDVKVMSIDEKGKISLSIRKVQESKKNKKQNRPYETRDPGRTAQSNMTFEQKLSKYLKDSEEKLGDLKKNFESKRGGGGYKKLTKV